MWTLTGFADEISPELSEQLATLEQEQMRFLELRAVWGKNVLELSAEELDRVKTTLREAGVGVSSVGSPIGKTPITQPFEPQLERFRTALHAAQVLGAPYIRIFSFYMPEGEDRGLYRGEVVDRLGALTDEARGAGVTLLHENEKGIYGDTPGRCVEILSGVDSPLLRAAWDPENFIQEGVRPHTEGYALLRPYIEYVHVKDAVLGTGQVVPAGEGDGELRETIAALRESGFDGYFSLEPHLKAAGPLGGFSGPELFLTAAQAFQGLLREQVIPYA